MRQSRQGKAGGGATPLGAVSRRARLRVRLRVRLRPARGSSVA
jgi:hypothetical protein